MSNLQILQCYVCGLDCHASAEAETVMCGSCVQGRTEHVRKKQMEEQEGMVCADHPGYGGIRKPRTSCKTCEEIYKRKVV